MAKEGHGRQFATSMSATVKDQLLRTQNECTFIWSTNAGDGIGTVMSYLWHDNSLWLTTNDSRPRVGAVRARPRACVVVSSTGTAMGISRCISIKGECVIHPMQVVKDWFLPEYCCHVLPNNPRGAEKMAAMLDAPGQVVLQVIPEKFICYDGHSLMSGLNAL